MLRLLSIRNFVVVETLDLELDAGFTVLTGETGAGKSILLDALGRLQDGELLGRLKKQAEGFVAFVERVQGVKLCGAA